MRFVKNESNETRLKHGNVLEMKMKMKMKLKAFDDGDDVYQDDDNKDDNDAIVLSK
jgi:hypothetical protein